MLPIPTPTAYAAFTGALVTLGVGILSSSPPVVSFGGAILLGLALTLAATMPVGRRVRRRRLEFAWWLGHGEVSAGGGAVVPGSVFEVRCFLRHRGTEPLLLTDLSPILPGGAEQVDREPRALRIAPDGRTEFKLRLVAPAVGRVVMHGLAITLPGPLGLFAVPLYFPNPLVIKVLPRAAARLRGAQRTITGIPVERSGSSLLSPHGGGTELRELRELRPGDPYKSIAWKASARRGKLLVREVEQEVQETRYVILDVSGTMRGGAPGSRKLDFAIEGAAALARRTADQGDRLGLITVDGRLLAHLPPKDGRAHLLRIFESLLNATEVVDQDLTDVDDEEVVGIVGRYVRQQDGVDFSTEGGEGPRWNVSMLVRHVREALKDEKAAKVVAGSSAGVALRRFCKVRGIPLPYRPDPRDGTKGPGLAAALKAAGGRKKSPMSIVVITDFDGFGEPDLLTSTVKLIRMHGHALSFVMPDATSFLKEPKEAFEREVYQVYARGERRRFEEAKRLLAPLGVPVIRAKAEDNPGLLLARAYGRRRAA